MKKRIYLIIFLIILLISLLAYFLTLDTNKYFDLQNERNIANEISQTNDYEDPSKNKTPKQWMEINNDYVMSIEVFNKQLPIVKSKIKDKYLHTNIYGEDDFYGTPYLDTDNHIDDANLIIYGHSSSKKDLVFSFIKKFESDNIWQEIEDNKLIATINNENYTYIPYALIKLDQGTDNNYMGWYNFNIAEEEDFKLLTKEIIEYGERIQTTNDKYKGHLITLVTCNLQNENDNLRYVLIYRRI